MIVALTAYPLSRDYRQSLELALGAIPAYLTLAELRRLTPLAMLRTLRSIRAEVVLPMEDANSRAIIPVVGILAALSRTRRIEVVGPDLGRESFSRAHALVWMIRGAGASVAGFLVALLCRVELKRLARLPRTSVSATEGPVAYLKTNLWFGVKAGGSVGHIAGVVNAMVRRGIEVVFFSAEPPTMVDPAVQLQRIEPPAVFGLPAELNNYRFHRIFFRKALRFLRSRRIGFVYQRLSIANYTGVVLSRRLGVPLVIEYNGSEAWVAKNWGRPLRFHRLAVAAEDVCLRHAQTIVTISEVLRDELISRGVEPERIVTYPNCVDPAVFDPARFPEREIHRLREGYGIPADATVVTFVGTFGQWHGVEVFALAIRRLVDHAPELLEKHNVRFLLVGDGLRRAEVGELLGAEPYRGVVVMSGLVPQDQAPLHLAASDILVSPHVKNADGSRFFGSPTKLFEYMAMGKPIAASDLDQIGAVLHGSPRVSDIGAGEPDSSSGTAVLTEPGNADDLARAIRLLVENREWASRLGRQARELALRKYTWDQHVEAIFAGIEGRADTQ